MTISILTLFPEMFDGPFAHSIVKRAREKNLLTINLVNIRDFGIGKHRIVDDTPYGGGTGMILRADVIDKAITSVRITTKGKTSKERVALLDARGTTFNQKKAKEFATLSHLILVAGHYEGVDERVKTHLTDEMISIGDYILTGGEIPVMAIVDAVARLIPGVIKSQATVLESFSPLVNDNTHAEKLTLQTTLEYPQYTKPKAYKNLKVPQVLLAGNHEKIARWRLEQSMQITKRHRPDLLSKHGE